MHTAARLQAALDALRAGHFGIAADRFVEVAAEVTEARDASRAWRLAATARRFAGDAEPALEHARQARSFAIEGMTLGEAALEVGESLRTLGRFDEAVASYDEAVQQLEGSARLVARGRRALTLALAGQLDLAADEIDAIARDVDPADVQRGFEALGEEHGRALATLVSALAATPAAPPGDDGERSDQAMLRCARHVLDGDLEAAYVATLEAREAARLTADPVRYAAACLAQAEVAERRDDRALAYEAVAVGWATLARGGDNEVARTAFEPAMQDLVERWGRDDYLAIRSAYDQQQRGQGSGHARPSWERGGA
ncbi:hypothetical protein [Nitriliruptor alkaliphilus]|uniref:hypothetical protein n=1 Tax=Nitriliruptor alkaliphilus TaxID=427918 RepID=UPI0006986C31|nr:hypothetical protein [Nitriliruptor alkaliphilus]